MSDADSPPDSPLERRDDEREDDDNPANDSDKDSDLLSEIDENQFDDYDPATAQVEERPVNLDEDVVKTLKASKRKRADGDGAAPRKVKEGRREKKRKTTGRDDDDVGGEVLDGKRTRKTRPAAAADGERRTKQKSPTEDENEEHLSPEERRRRAIDRAIDAAVRNPTKRRRKKDEVDLEEAADEQIAKLKIEMEKACIADINSRADGRPAFAKVKLLPQVVSLLHRNDIQETVLDPETNFLQSVRFFLEPLNDGSLPAFVIQRDIFQALESLPIEKDVLLSSGIGKVVLFYTRSKKVQPAIKRTAERLLGEWSRPILKRTDDFRKRHIETRDFDHRAMQRGDRDGSQYTLTQRPAASQQSRYEVEKDRALAPVVTNPNRARPVSMPQSYTVAPKSTFDGAARSANFKPIGAGGLEAFRKMTQKGKGKKN